MGKQILIGIIALILIVGLTYTGYTINRNINWSWGYEDKVEEKIREMVKEEALK